MDQVSYLLASTHINKLLTGCFIFLFSYFALRRVAPSWFASGSVMLITPHQPGRLDKETTVTQFVEKHAPSLKEGFKPSWWLPR